MHEQRNFAVWAWGGREIAIIDLKTMTILQVIKSGRKEGQVAPEEKKLSDKDGVKHDEEDVERDIFGEVIAKQDDLRTLQQKEFQGVRGEDIECIDVAEHSKDIVCYGTVDHLDSGETEQCLVIYGL